MTKQGTEINGSGEKIRSIAEFLINGATVSFTPTETDNSPTTFLTQNEGRRSNMHNECGSEISFRQKIPCICKINF